MSIDSEKKLIDNSRFSQLLDVKTIQYEKGEVVLQLTVDEHHKNAIQTVHGGVLATLIDNVIGATITSITNLPSTTINLNIQYLKPVQAGILTVKATILHLGYRIVTGEGIVVDEEDNAIAKGSGTFKLLRPKKKDFINSNSNQSIQ
jgi:uncharacterized protein (TIGR00369 family)